MMRSGKVEPGVSMKISGHKTDSMHRRYRIVAEDDIEKALAATQASLKLAPVSNVTRLDAKKKA
jgi:hypothetical protein